MSKAAEESGTRRSGRDRIRPLDFWANERVVYERGQICGVITNDVPHSSTEVAERPQRIATPPKVAASPPKRARSSHREGDSLTRGDTKRSRRPAALQGKGQSRGRDDTAEGELAAPRPAAPPPQPRHASPRVPLQPPPKKRRREVVEVAADDEDTLVGLEDLDQAAAAATAAAGAAAETAPALAASSSAPQLSAEVGVARAGGMAGAGLGVERERERVGTEKDGGSGSSDGGGGGDDGGGDGNGESQVGSEGSGEAAAAAAAATAAAEAEVAEATARAEAMVVAAEKAAEEGAEAEAEVEAEAEEGGARGDEGRGEEAELEEAAQMGMAAAVELANQLDANEHGDPHATLHGLPEARGRLPARVGRAAAPLPGGLSETAAACDVARAAPVSEAAAVPTTRGDAPAFAPAPAPAKRVLDSRRWGRGWQYLVSSRADAADACWLEARDTPQPLIDDFEARSCSNGDPSASEQPRVGKEEV